MTHAQKWKPKQIEYLRLNYGKVDIDILAANLERTPKAVRAKAADMGLMKARAMRKKPQVVDVSVLQQDIPDRPLKAFNELKGNECRYGYYVTDVKFCGHEVVKGKPYCKEHMAVCYKKEKK